MSDYLERAKNLLLSLRQEWGRFDWRMFRATDQGGFEFTGTGLRIAEGVAASLEAAEERGWQRGHDDGLRNYERALEQARE